LVSCAKGRIETAGVCEDSAGNNIWTWMVESKKKVKKIHDVGKSNPWTGPGDSRRLKLPDFKTIGIRK
jgi:hypothetical protein